LSINSAETSCSDPQQRPLNALAAVRRSLFNVAYWQILLQKSVAGFFGQ